MNQSVDSRIAGLKESLIDLQERIKTDDVSITELKQFINELKVKDVDQLFHKSQNPSPAPEVLLVGNPLFGTPTLIKRVMLAENFSLEGNVQPRQEYKYGAILTDGFKNEYFAESNLTGLVTLAITPLTRESTVRKIVLGFNQTDAIALVNALHQTLIEDESQLEQYKDNNIIIPVLSNWRDEEEYNDDYVCLSLFYGDGVGWFWTQIWLDIKLKAGTGIATLSQ
jgi:hypothetical protein